MLFHSSAFDVTEVICYSKQILIFEEDKGGTIVVMNKSDYITDSDGNRIYTKLTLDCTKKFVCNIGNAVQNAVINNVIDDDLSDLLIIDYPKPKIQKNNRPICNTINTFTTNLSEWVDIQLQALVKNLHSYLLDDNQFLKKNQQDQ